jgi:hypothetical protein
MYSTFPPLSSHNSLSPKFTPNIPLSTCSYALPEVLSHPKDKTKREEIKSLFIWALPLFEMAHY